MTRTALVTRDPRREAENVERTWPCSGRAPQRRGQRAVPRSPLRKVLLFTGGLAGSLVALPVVLILLFVVAAPFAFVMLWVVLRLLGLDSGTGGGTD